MSPKTRGVLLLLLFTLGLVRLGVLAWGPHSLGHLRGYSASRSQEHAHEKHETDELPADTSMTRAVQDVQDDVDLDPDPPADSTWWDYETERSYAPTKPMDSVDDNTDTQGDSSVPSVPDDDDDDDDIDEDEDDDVDDDEEETEDVDLPALKEGSNRVYKWVGLAVLLAVHMYFASWSIIWIIESHLRTIGKVLWVAVVAYVPLLGSLVWMAYHRCCYLPSRSWSRSRSDSSRGAADPSAANSKGLDEHTALLLDSRYQGSTEHAPLL
jgi:hypothetical protein